MIVLAAVAGLLMAAGPAIANRADAANAGWRQLAAIHITNPANITAGLHRIWVLAGDEFSYAHLIRIDPRTNQITGRWRYSDGGVGIAVAAGSVWISQYNADEVLRIDPDDGRVIATIRVGLQPEAVHTAFGMVWVGNHHGQSVSRIDPAVNAVIATYPVGDPHAYRSGPQDITDYRHRLYVGASDKQSLTAISPYRNRVVSTWDTPSDQFCGDLNFVRGQLWSVDECTNRLFHLGLRPHRQTAIGYGAAALTSATRHHQLLWVTSNSHPGTNDAPPAGGTLQARDPMTGRLRLTMRIGGDAEEVRSFLGSLWVRDPTNDVVRRIEV